MSESQIAGILPVKYVCRSFGPGGRHLLNKCRFITTFHSYDRYAMRERMRRPFFKEKEAGENVAVYANRLARNLNFDRREWEKVVARAKETHAELRTADVALLVNSLSRARAYDAELFNALVPQIIKKISFLSSVGTTHAQVHIAMVLSAYSKGKLLSPELYNVFKFEIANRLYEFRTGTEMVMIVNAIAKFGFLRKICSHIIRTFTALHLTPQELSVIVHAFVTVGHYNEELFNKISSNLRNHLDLCNVYELVRVLNGFMLFENDSNDIQSQCKRELVDKISHAGPAELTNTLHALGNTLHTANSSNIELNAGLIAEIADALKKRALGIIEAFAMADLAHMLAAYARGQFGLEQHELARVLEMMGRTKMDLDLGDLSNTLSAITKLVGGTDGDKIRAKVQALMRTWAGDVAERVESGKRELGAVVRVLDAYHRLK